MPYRRFFYIIEIYKKSSFLSPISVFYKPNRLKVAKIQPNKNLIRNCPKKEILTAKIFSYLKDQKRVSVFAYVPLTSRESQIRTSVPVNGTADPLQLSALTGGLLCCIKNEEKRKALYGVVSL